jgi:hypothetical protein
MVVLSDLMMRMGNKAMANYFYRLVCTESYGWDGDCDESLWGYDYCSPENRVFYTKKEAKEAMQSLINAGCWTTEEYGEQIPEFDIKKCTVYEACFMDDDFDYQKDEIAKIVEIHGKNIELKKMPAKVKEFMMKKYSYISALWSQESDINQIQAR